MARTLEMEEEESRIAELERIASEGDEIEKMIAEVELAEERKRVARDAAYAIQAEEETETPLVPRIKSKTVLPKSTKQVIENERAGLGKELGRDVSKAVKELKPAGLPEKPTPMELLFTKKELALHKASEEAKLQKALSKVTAKSADEAFEERERYRKDKLEKYPKATFKQRLVEGFGIGLTPATKANVESARAVGAAMDDFDARMKVDKATSSAKSARIGAAIGGVETKAIVDVMTGMSDRANLKYLNEVRAKSGSFFKNFLNVGPDATPAEEKAAQERVIWLARQGNKTEMLKVEALASQYNSFAAARKLTVASERVAAQKRSDALWADAVAAQQLHATNLGEGAVDENGIYQESSLPPHVRESMLDEKGKLNLFGYHVRAGGKALINEDNKAIRTQIRDNRSESESIAYQEASVLGSTIVPFDSRPLDQKISLTNRKNLDDRMKRLETTREYTAAMQGKPPESIKNSINFRNSLLKHRTDVQKELEGVDRFSERGRDLMFALGRINRGIFEADGEINTAFAGMASATRRITEGEKTEEEFQKARQLEDARLGQKRMDDFRKLVNVDELEAKATGHQTEGIGAGGGFYEFAFFKPDGKGGYSDVKDVFHPWLDTHTLVSKGGVPVLGGFLPDDLTKKSNAYVFKPDGPDVETGTFVRVLTKAQQIAYTGSLDQWQDKVGGLVLEKQEPEVEEFGEGMTGEEGMEQPPELTELGQPLTVPISPSLAVVRKRMASILNDPRTKKPWVFGARFNNPDDGIVYIFDGVEWQEK
tara:strand:- start:236 stop:2548 length:2313 start_codon:yes stop_codon:yes gene_type:complete